MYNPFEKVKLTNGEFVKAVLAVDNETDARRLVGWYRAYLKNRRALHIQLNQARIDARTESLEIESDDKTIQNNIGFCFNEGMPVEKQRLWAKVCGAASPW
jgi:hypothetical protein